MCWGMHISHKDIDGQVLSFGFWEKCVLGLFWLGASAVGYVAVALNVCKSPNLSRAAQPDTSCISAARPEPYLTI